MANNATEKLFEEMREAKIAYQAAQAALKQCDIDYRDAAKRVKLLEDTLEKHIHDGVPILQAKMIAHEEQGELELINGNLIVAGTITGSKIASNSITAAKISAHCLAAMSTKMYGIGGGTI